MEQAENSELKQFLADNPNLVDRALYHVPIGAVIPDPEQPRKHLDEKALKDLGGSIEKYGVLQPVIFRKGADGSLVLVSGERRYWASQLAGKATLPGVFNESGNSGEIALVENLQREDLNPIETAEGLDRLKVEKGYTNVQLSAVICKAESTISEILSLNKLPEAVKKGCREDGGIPRRVLVEIAKEKDEAAMVELFAEYRKKGLKSDDLRKTGRVKKSSGEVWLKAIDGFSKRLGKLDFGGLGDDADGVKKGLKELEKAIKKKLS